MTYSTLDHTQEPIPVQEFAYKWAIDNVIDRDTKVLDVGFGLGVNGIDQLLDVVGIKIFGVEVDQRAVDRAQDVYASKKKVVELLHYDGDVIPYTDVFDVVLCVDVLEHVEDPVSFIQQLLKAGKTVVISTPNRLPEHTNVDGTPKNRWHLREWNLDEFTDVLHEVGGEVSYVFDVDITFVNGPHLGPHDTGDYGKDTQAMIAVLRREFDDD